MQLLPNIAQPRPSRRADEAHTLDEAGRQSNGVGRRPGYNDHVALSFRSYRSRTVWNEEDFDAQEGVIRRGFEDEQHVVPGKVEKGGGFAASGSVACGELSARVAKAADWLEGRMQLFVP